MQNIRYTNDVAAALGDALGADAARVVWIVDENSARHVLPALRCVAPDAPVVTLAAGDDHKTLEAARAVWDAMEAAGATRQSVAVNVGGGMVTDLGGFAAAAFKRGIRFVNVATTLLGAVDAAVGGKVGVNYHGLKNEIGFFAEASDVIISTRFFATLPDRELASGFAEMLKHGLLMGATAFDALLDVDLKAYDDEALLQQVRASVEYKLGVVRDDPREQGVRRALNLGHTVGHALEALALRQGAPVPHGYAVAWGLLAETVISHLTLQFSSELVYRLGHFVRDVYGVPAVTCDDYPALLELMRHDKKSRAGEINCTLLAACGDVRIDQTVNAEDVRAALDITRDLLGS